MGNFRPLALILLLFWLLVLGLAGAWALIVESPAPDATQEASAAVR
jgi:hypothetical protein